MTSEPTYTVTWRRPGDTEWLSCSGLDIRTVVARAVSATRTNNYIEVKLVEREAEVPE